MPQTAVCGEILFCVTPNDSLAHLKFLRVFRELVSNLQDFQSGLRTNGAFQVGAKNAFFPRKTAVLRRSKVFEGSLRGTFFKKFLS
jgi:hypothetical protein